MTPIDNFDLTHTSIQSHSNQMAQKNAIKLYLGGSFDPVHNSHLDLLTHVYQQLNSEHQPVQAYFMPTSRSPLKADSSESKHRLHMLTAAINERREKHLATTASASTTALPPQTDSKMYSNITISEQEIWQNPPTYTIDTLSELRKQSPHNSLIFIVGADNIANLAKWRDGEKLTEYAHLWIFPRNSLQTPSQIYDILPESLKPQVTHCVSDLKKHTHGYIYIDSHTVAPLSSSSIRAAIGQGEVDIAKSALPHSVYSYIMKNNLYHSY